MQLICQTLFQKIVKFNQTVMYFELVCCAVSIVIVPIYVKC